MNVLQNFLAGREARRQSDAADRVNAMQSFMQEQGQAIFQGDQNALGQLAGYDPMMAMNIRQQQEQGQRAQVADQRAQASAGREEWRFKRETEEYAAGLSAQEAAKAAAEMEQGLKLGMSAQSEQEWDALMQKYGHEELVGRFGDRDALVMQVVPMIEALKMKAGPEPQSPEGKLTADMRAGLVDQQTLTKTDPAAEQKVRRLMETGLDRETAIGIADGRLVESRDPVRGTAQIIDKATGKIVGELPPEVATSAQPQVGTSMPEGMDFTKATGAWGFASQLANTVTDAIGSGLISPENETATQAMNNLATRTMVTLADGVAGRPSNFLLEKFQELTTTPNSIWEGEGRTIERLNQTRAMVQEAILLNQDVMQSSVTPQMQAEAQQNILRLSRLLNDYDAVLQDARRGARGTGNKTSTGIEWSIEE